MAVSSWIKEELKKRGVSYSELCHQSAYTAQGLAEVEHMSGNQVAKVVVVIAGGRPIQAVLPASRMVDLERVAGIAGAAEAHLASETEMARLFPDCELGAEPPLPHWNMVELWVDESLRTDREIVFPAGTHQDRIRMLYPDWQRVARPKVASFSRGPR